ncbi:MAG TPA: acyltransferase [Nitrospiraceae bacterium]|nr:acyltransferase [Nitrospiraceae bacterium]
MAVEVADRNAETVERVTGHSAVAYLSSLDGLRGIAILLVTWYHVPFLFRDDAGLPREMLEGTLQRVFWGMSLAGWVGVDLFFVISGLLITSILLWSREVGSPLQVFWYRRGLRILPLAVLYLLILQVNTILLDPLGVLKDFNGWLAYLFYAGNLHIALNGWQPIVVMILWSLAVEEQFYLVWPIVVHWFNRKALLMISLMMIALSPLARSLAYSFLDYPAVYVLTFCRLDALASGAVIALLISSETTKAQTMSYCRRWSWLAFGILFVTFLGPFSPSFPQTRPLMFTLFGYTWIAVAWAVLVGASLRCEGGVRSALSSRPLTFVGKRCYGFYLWHALMAGVVMKMVDALSVNIGFYGQLVLWLCALIAVASLSWSCFERPILRLKRLVPYSAPSQVRAISLGA